jgi:hypothetical protein
VADIGASVDTGIIRNDTNAQIDGAGTRVGAGGIVDFNALTNWAMGNITVRFCTGAVGVNFGIIMLPYRWEFL